MKELMANQYILDEMETKFNLYGELVVMPIAVLSSAFSRIEKVANTIKTMIRQKLKISRSRKTSNNAL